MTDQTERTWYMPLLTAAAEKAAKRELAAVRASIAAGEKFPLAHAFHGHRKYLVLQMSWSDAQSDVYCGLRIQQLAREGIPADDLVFIQNATALLIEITVGEYL
jgi:hypothetical protein